MKLRLAIAAQSDLRSAANWYDAQRDGLGDEFLEELATAIREIERDPLRFARVATVRTRRDIRTYRLARFPYSVVYERIGEESTVIAVAHAKRRPSYWLRRKTDG